ncbi:MAG: beta-lactamase family protein [Deltaproteobacteria bacterium]|nr:beta-lactamase family protein [Deltaproteobacteria bacterium]
MEGTLHPDFYFVAETLRRQLAKNRGGAAVCIYHRGEKVVDLWGGVRDERGTPWVERTMSPSFSTTKGVASTVVHLLVDQGLLDYDDKVAKHWPEFAQEGKGEITIRHVMAHQSGLYHLRQMLDHADQMLDWEFVTDSIARAKPVHAPGARTGYHGLSYGFIIGEIIQRVTGRKFSEVVQSELAIPLEADGLYIGAPEEALQHAAQLIVPENGFSMEAGVWVERAASSLQDVLACFGVETHVGGVLELAPRGLGSLDFSAAETLRVAMPSHNGLFTARSLAKMYAAWANGGQIGDLQLISERTVRRATQRQSRPAHAYPWPIDMGWCLGFHRAFTTRGIPEGAFGHYGFGGSGAFADPRRRLAVGLIVNSGQGTPFGDVRTAQLGGAAIRSVDERS